MFEIYKRGQGKYVRIVTAVVAMGIILVGAAALSTKLAGYGATRSPLIRFGVPSVLVVLVGLLVFRMVNRQRSADFLIATEGEMKKVSWTSRREIVGSTKVVIVTTLILAVLLFAVDIVFVRLFVWIGVMS